MLKKLVYLLISLCLLSISVYSQDISRKLDKDLLAIEKTLQKQDTKDIDPDNVLKIKQELRKIQTQAQEKVSILEEERETQQEYLKTLGDAPDTEKGEKEAEEVSTLRKTINNKLVEIEGKIKSARLVIVRSSDIISNLNDVRQENLQSKLSERIPSPFHPNVLVKAFEQVLTFSTKISFDIQTFILITAFLGLMIIAFPLTRKINHYRQSSLIFSIIPISYRLIIQFFISSYFILVIRFSKIQDNPYSDFIHVTQAICVIVLAISLWELFNKLKLKNTSDATSQGYVSPLWRNIKNYISYAILIFIPLVAVGFTEFSVFVLFNFFALIFVLFIFVSIRYLIIKLLTLKNNHTEDNKKALEPTTIIILEPILAVISIALLLLLWGIDFTEIKLWLSQYSTGIPIGQLTLNFKDLGAALVSFTTIYLIFRVIKWFLSARVFPNAELDIGIVNAVLTILGYIGIALAIFSAGGALGFDASNLALVAGALSVGIGFGLQTIFSNFVSGLILLFERPFKVGDWVNVNGFEGIIRRISVRSTEIETFQRFSVIVPNSQMISDVVTNRTLHNTMARLEIAVGVAYGSDTKRVEEILLECAHENKDILRYPQPHVLFMNFGDSSLDFELRCFTNDAFSPLTIGSDLRFAIDNKFKENNIEIPFPQRDLHIKQTILHAPEQPLIPSKVKEEPDNSE